MKKYYFYTDKLFWHLSYFSLILVSILIIIGTLVEKHVFLWQLLVVISVLVVLYILTITWYNKKYYIAIDQNNFLISNRSLHEEKAAEPIPISEIKLAQYVLPKRFGISFADHGPWYYYLPIAVKLVMKDNTEYIIDLGGLGEKSIIDFESTILQINPSICFPKNMVQFLFSKIQPEYTGKHPLK